MSSQQVRRNSPVSIGRSSKYTQALARKEELGFLCFEMTFWVVLFAPGLTYIYFTIGILFHLGTYITMRINYLKYLTPIYTVFIANVVCKWLITSGH